MTRRVEARERCKDAAPLALKVEEGAVNKGEQAASRSREARDGFSPWSLQKGSSPANALLLAQGDLFWISDLQNSERILVLF